MTYPASSDQTDEVPDYKGKLSVKEDQGFDDFDAFVNWDKLDDDSSVSGIDPSSSHTNFTPHNDSALTQDFEGDTVSRPDQTLVFRQREVADTKTSQVLSKRPAPDDDDQDERHDQEHGHILSEIDWPYHDQDQDQAQWTGDVIDPSKLSFTPFEHLPPPSTQLPPENSPIGNGDDTQKAFKRHKRAISNPSRDFHVGSTPDDFRSLFDDVPRYELRGTRRGRSISAVSASSTKRKTEQPLFRSLHRRVVSAGGTPSASSNPVTGATSSIGDGTSTEGDGPAEDEEPTNDAGSMLDDLDDQSLEQMSRGDIMNIFNEPDFRAD